MRRCIGVCLCAMLIGAAGCASSKANLSPMQKRQITTRQVDGSYENVFRASMTVLQDQGYVVKNTDMNSGLIVASVDRETAKSSQFWQAFWVGAVYDKGTYIECTMTVGEINQNLQELRMNLQETRYTQTGEKTDVKQITEARAYEELANQIKVEVKRREALGR